MQNILMKLKLIVNTQSLEWMNRLPLIQIIIDNEIDAKSPSTCSLNHQSRKPATNQPLDCRSTNLPKLANRNIMNTVAPFRPRKRYRTRKRSLESKNHLRLVRLINE